jgi:hypothetical protein
LANPGRNEFDFFLIVEGDSAMRSFFWLLPLMLLPVLGCQSKEERVKANVRSLGGILILDPNNAEIVTGIKFPAQQESPLTDSGMRYLEAECFANVNTVHLAGSKITDAGLDSLKGMSKLQELDLDLTAITDAGLAKLQGLTQLKRLRLRGTKITDQGIGYLEPLKNLEDLDLGNIQENSQITDAALSKLKGLDNLRMLHLDGTKVTDEGLKSLRDLPKLTLVGTARTAVTEGALKDLQTIMAKHGGGRGRGRGGAGGQRQGPDPGRGGPARGGPAAQGGPGSNPEAADKKPAQK